MKTPWQQIISIHLYRFLTLFVLGSVCGLWFMWHKDTLPPIRILFTGETLGRLSACMCEGELAGGLDFRATAISNQSAPFLLLDTGNVASGNADEDKVRAHVILTRMIDMGYTAINIGESEAAYGSAWIREQTEAGAPFVSLNLRVEAGMAPTSFKPTAYRCVPYLNQSVMVTGLIDPAYRVPPSWRIESPTVALERLIAERKQLGWESRPLIVLADITRQYAEEIARTFPEISAILLRARNDTLMPTRVNHSILASVYGSRYLADLRLTWDSPSHPHEVKGTMQVITLVQDKTSLPASTIPDGIFLTPTQLHFDNIQQGASVTRQLHIANRTGEAITITRVYSPCTCFVMDFPQVPLEDGADADIQVTLHSVSLEGENQFSLYIKTTGTTDRIFSIPASVTTTSHGKGF